MCCNANDQIISKVQDYLATKALIDELQTTLDGLADEIKAYMDANEADEMQAGASIVSYKEVSSKRLNTIGLKKLLGDALDPYYTLVTSKRFTVR